jgi:hypothetical protein
MMTFRSTILAMIVAMLAGCASSGTPQDGRYQTHGNGWDNFRA